jgi:hypothetical protein
VQLFIVKIAKCMQSNILTSIQNIKSRALYHLPIGFFNKIPRIKRVAFLGINGPLTLNVCLKKFHKLNMHVNLLICCWVFPLLRMGKFYSLHVKNVNIF